jgi:hypothetical protein
MNNVAATFVTGIEPTFIPMNTKLVLASIVAAWSGLAGLATTANAGTDFKIRVNIGTPPPPPIIVVEDHHRGRGHGHHPHHVAPRGYWKDVSVKVWVPSRWIVSRDRWGHEVRTHVRGHYTYRTDRVWVDTNRDHGHGRHGGHVSRR